MAKVNLADIGHVFQELDGEDASFASFVLKGLSYIGKLLNAQTLHLLVRPPNLDCFRKRPMGLATQLDAFLYYHDGEHILNLLPLKDVQVQRHDYRKGIGLPQKTPTEFVRETLLTRVRDIELSTAEDGIAELVFVANGVESKMEYGFTATIPHSRNYSPNRFTIRRESECQK